MSNFAKVSFNQAKIFCDIWDIIAGLNEITHLHTGYV